MLASDANRLGIQRVRVRDHFHLELGLRTLARVSVTARTRCVMCVGGMTSE